MLNKYGNLWSNTIWTTKSAYVKSSVRAKTVALFDFVALTNAKQLPYITVKVNGNVILS